VEDFSIGAEIVLMWPLQIVYMPHSFVFSSQTFHSLSGGSKIVGYDFPVLGVLFIFVAIGVFWLFFAAGESLTPKKSLLTGKERSKEEISRKGLTKGVVLFFIAIIVINLFTGILND